MPTRKFSDHYRKPGAYGSSSYRMSKYGICKVCGKPIDVYHDMNACADEWTRRQDAGRKEARHDD